ncbi:UNVERIFIED_CONTAM: L-type lectin-domain containing receptor kinase IX.2 [Sesamum radiatum]|uniref:L-type lectin-domain containing receptor kinase IX.2 n=1 Tax=Sesamum radiatum TaxID=300843 RepID=A0AAW2R334_SESRA
MCLLSPFPSSFSFLFSHSANFQLSRSTPHATTIFPEADAVTSARAIQFNDVDYRCHLDQVVCNKKVPLWDSKSGELADFTTRFSFTVDAPNSSSNASGNAFFLEPVGFGIPPNSVGGFLGVYVAGAGDFPQPQTDGLEFDSFVVLGEWDLLYDGINTHSLNTSVATPWNGALLQLFAEIILTVIIFELNNFLVTFYMTVLISMY